MHITDYIHHPPPLRETVVEKQLQLPLFLTKHVTNLLACIRVEDVHVDFISDRIGRFCKTLIFESDRTDRLHSI